MKNADKTTTNSTRIQTSKKFMYPWHRKFKLRSGKFYYALTNLQKLELILDFPKLFKEAIINFGASFSDSNIELNK